MPVKIYILYNSKHFLNHIKILYIVFFSTEKIDKRLGYFQNKFNLHGNEVRALATKQPKIITYSIQHINTNTFVINEEMGFNEEETKKLLLDTPKIWMLSKLTIL